MTSGTYSPYSLPMPHQHRGGRAKLFVIKTIGRRGACVVKHGLSKTKTFKSWEGAKQRCTNPHNHQWLQYGGRGIKVCERWLNSFENFLADVGHRPPGMTLDRIDVNGDYEPGNCRWATPKEQSNNRRDCVLMTYQRKTQTMTQWARELGINQNALWMRVNYRGWSVERALSTPVRRKAIGAVKGVWCQS